MSDHFKKMSAFLCLRYCAILVTLMSLLSTLCVAGGKQKSSKKNKSTKTTAMPDNRPRGCFVQQRVVWVPIPKYKYVDVPMAEPVYEDKKKKGKAIKSYTEVPISKYTRTSSYGDF